MRYYETMYIVNPGFEEERLNKVIETINEEFDNKKVKVINHYVWGKKRLAYPIQKHQYGNYILIHFESDERQFLLNFAIFLKLNTSVMRHQTVRLDKQPDVVESHEIIIEDEIIESDQSTKEQDTSNEDTLISDSVDTENEEITEESEQESEPIIEKSQQEETEEENVNLVQQEETEE